MLFSMAKRFGPRRKLKKIKNIKFKASKKFIYSIRNSSSSASGSDSSLSSDIEWYKIRQTNGRKEKNKLDHVVTNNIKKK